MPRLSKKLPSYRLHKASGQAIVTFNGSDHYLGAWNSPESKDEYDRLIGEWLTAGRQAPKPAQESAQAEPTVREVILAFWTHAETHYRGPDKKPSQELDNFRAALKQLKRLYAPTAAKSFGPLALRAVREAMIKSGLARTTVNARINRIRRVFRWAASVEMIPGSVVESLRTVSGLQEGRSEAHETDPVKPVPIETVAATLPHLPRPVAAMVRLQLLTGCRAGEVRCMRRADLTPGEPTWEYRPGRHKNSWRGHKRMIPLGPQAQEIVREFLTPDLNAYLFDPRSVANSGCVAQTKDRYDRRAYSQAIGRACDRLFPHPMVAEFKSRIENAPLGKRRRLMAERRKWMRENAGVLLQWRRDHRWSPLQLRHTTATLVRARYGLEAAQNVLGHASPKTTLIYAEPDMGKVHEIAAEIG